jgi:hypothetical protein
MIKHHFSEGIKLKPYFYNNIKREQVVEKLMTKYWYKKITDLL